MGQAARERRDGSRMVQTMPIRLTPKTTIGSVMPYDLAFGLSYDAAGNAADVPIGRRGGSVPAGCPVAGGLCVPVLRLEWGPVRIREQVRHSEVPPVPARHVDHRRYRDARHEDSAAGMVLGGVSGDDADAGPIGGPVSTATWSESLRDGVPDTPQATRSDGAA